MSDPRDDDAMVRLPIRIRETEYGSGESTRGATVHCPLKGDTSTLEHCASCPRYLALSDEAGTDPALLCRVPRASTSAPDKPGEDLLSKLLSTPVRELMTSRVTCLDSELSLSEASELLTQHDLHAAPVVEDAGVLIGMLSHADLAREGSFNSTHALVDDAMTPRVTRLAESATAAEAAALFARTGLHRVPVVSGRDRVVGILSVIDLVRWLAMIAKL